MKVVSQQGGTEMSYLVKGDKVRMDMAGMGGMSVYVVRDLKANTTQMVMPSRKMFFEPPQMQGMGAAAAKAGGKEPDVKMTGKKETIGGYECEHMIVTGDDGSFDVCGAKGFGTFTAPGAPGGGGATPAASGWERIGEFFPLKVQKVGGEVVMEVTKIEKKLLEDSLFTIPADFQKLDMGRMGRPPR
jgi:hypothetical protein